MAFELRPADARDSTEINGLLIAAGIAEWGPWLGKEVVRAANRDAVHPADLVAVDNVGICGFVAWDAKTGEIVRMYTHPRVWGNGIGRALLDRALAELKSAGVAKAWLRTEVRNARPRRFYIAHGWREEGELHVDQWHGLTVTQVTYVRDL